MMINKKILFLGRYRDFRSRKLLQLLKKKFLEVSVIWSKNPKQKFPKKYKKWVCDYIICYRSYFILKKNTIKRAKFAINFHPGNPKYRGRGCLNFAIFNKEKKYGATAHLINEKIDNGKIILVKEFKIKKNITVLELSRKTEITNYNLAKEIINIIYKGENFLISLIKSNIFKWSKKLYFKKDLDKLSEINILLNKNKINLIYRATAYKDFRPYLKILNYKIPINNEFK